MNELVTGILTLAAVCLGATASYVTTHLTERDKWKRAVNTRWDELRLNAYMAYAAALKQYLNVAKQIAGSMGYADIAHPLSADEGFPLLARAESERATCFEAVLLLGDDATIQAARVWHAAAWCQIEILQGRAPGGDAPFRQVTDRIISARVAFYQAARRSLNISSAHRDPPLPGAAGLETLRSANDR